MSPKDGLDPVKLLKEQHREVESLFEEFEGLGETASRSKQQLFEDVADRLAAHAAIEEQLFYPACRAKETEDELRESLEEHLAVKRVIADLLQLGPDDESFDAKMKVLQELVEHHVEEEEKELFPRAKKLLGDRAPVIAASMKELFDDLMDQQPRLQVPQETQETPPLEGP